MPSSNMSDLNLVEVNLMLPDFATSRSPNVRSDNHTRSSFRDELSKASSDRTEDGGSTAFRARMDERAQSDSFLMLQTVSPLPATSPLYMDQARTAERNTNGGENQKAVETQAASRPTGESRDESSPPPPNEQKGTTRGSEPSVGYRSPTDNLVTEPPVASVEEAVHVVNINTGGKFLILYDPQKPLEAASIGQSSQVVVPRTEQAKFVQDLVELTSELQRRNGQPVTVQLEDESGMPMTLQISPRVNRVQMVLKVENAEVATTLRGQLEEVLAGLNREGVEANVTVICRRPANADNNLTDSQDRRKDHADNSESRREQNHQKRRLRQASSQYQQGITGSNAISFSPA